MPSFVSLFCGCGGFDKGFIENGFTCLGAYDIDPLVVKVYNENIGPFGLVHDLSEGELPHIYKQDVDIVLSGSPCQGFSTAGKRRLEDPRNKLLLIGGKVAIKLSAKYFIAENVMGSIAGQHKEYWNSLEELMITNGYSVKFYTCDATKIGLPQSRKRVIMFCSRDHVEIDLSMPNYPMKTLKEALTNLDGAANHEKVF